MWRLFFAVLFVLSTAVGVVAQEWTVLRTQGDVRLSEDGRTWVRVAQGSEVPNPSWLRTGSSGRVILSRGNERMAYGPDTLAALVVSEPTGQKTRVTQRRGSILFDIETRRRRETTVVTPHLAAVVKGTVFQVDAGSGSSAVRVREGVVEVSSGQSRARVTAGQTASSEGAVIRVSETEREAPATGSGGVGASGSASGGEDSNTTNENGTSSEGSDSGSSGGGGSGGGSTSGGDSTDSSGGGSSTGGGSGGSSGGGGSGGNDDDQGEDEQ